MDATTIRSKRQAERFSPDQLRLSNSVKSLIQFYYAIKSSSFAENKYWRKHDEHLKKAITLIHEGNGTCSYNAHTHKYEIKHPRSPDNPQNVLIRKYSINAKQVRRFMSMMDDLVCEVAQQSPHPLHLQLRGVVSVATTTVTSRDQMDDAELDSIDYNSMSNDYRPDTDAMQRRVPMMEKSIIKTIRKKRPHEYMQTLHDDADTVSYSRRLRVKAVSQFGNRLLSTREVGATKIISHYAARTVTSFRRLSFYLLIHFHLAFNGFERLRCCSFCNKLFFEKKKGARAYCGDRCRGKANKLTEPDNKRKCRNRQNAWSRNRQLTYAVPKFECDKCNAYPITSGQCPILSRRLSGADTARQRKRHTNIVRQRQSR